MKINLNTLKTIFFIITIYIPFLVLFYSLCLSYTIDRSVLSILITFLYIVQFIFSFLMFPIIVIFGGKFIEKHFYTFLKATLVAIIISIFLNLIHEIAFNLLVKKYGYPAMLLNARKTLILSNIYIAILFSIQTVTAMIFAFCGKTFNFWSFKFWK